MTALLQVQTGAVAAIAESVALDPTFALGHSTLALIGHEHGIHVDLPGRVAAAVRHASRSTERERSHVHAVVSHLRGDSRPLIAHLGRHPRDALLLSVAVPTIAFAGVTTVPQDAWAIVERCAPAYGSDWWCAGLLAFVRQEQGRFDEALSLADSSLAEVPTAGHSVHARTHVHYETGDHDAGLAWMDHWIDTEGRTADNLAHFSWHAALHELSRDDVDAVRRRFETQLAPPATTGCRALVDSASLLWRWSLTDRDADLPAAGLILEHVRTCDLLEPSSGFMAMHAAIALCAAGDVERLRQLETWCATHVDPALRDVAGPLCEALLLLRAGSVAGAATLLDELQRSVWRLGGSDAQREVVEDTRIAALIACGRTTDAATLLDRRLDRRPSPRDSSWRSEALAAPRLS